NWGACQEGSALCKAIPCKFHAEEIHIINVPIYLKNHRYGLAATLSYYSAHDRAFSKPTGYGPSSRRSHNRGIVDECCFQSCELRRLEMYCAPVKPGKTPRSLRAQRHTDSPRTAKKPISGHSHSSCKEVHQKNSSRGNTGGRNYRM
uniref:Insulin-like growth factor I, adult form n=1 Tax=Sinocyclocheilus grahami TaxID=75366 RepID=A0A672QEC0_SINGR